MVDYATLATVAKTLLDDAGREISVVRLDQTAADAAKPWRGSAAPRGNGATTVTGRAAFVPLGGSDLGITFKAEEPAAEVCLFPAEDDDDEELELFDEIIDGSTRWRIIETQILQPGDTRLLYFFLVAR